MICHWIIWYKKKQNEVHVAKKKYIYYSKKKKTDGCDSSLHILKRESSDEEKCLEIGKSLGNYS